VLSYLQHRDARWRVWVDEFLARHPEPGIDRVLAIFDAAIGWSDDNSPKGCSAVNARAEIPDHATSGLVLPEVTRQKQWLLDRFAELITEAGLSDPGARARELMLLYEGAIVTVGMRTFRGPFETARAVAARLLAG
jgi:hypothetical protein